MDKLKIRQKVRYKPRYKIVNQVGYNVWGKQKFKEFYRKKWANLRNSSVTEPKYSNQGSLTDLFRERLKSRQVLRKMYGKMTERQFKAIFKQSEFGSSKSNKSLKGLLDRRLDAFVFRIGFANTIFKSRQDILHGSFKVNGKVVKCPSYLVKVGDFVSPNENVWDSVYKSFQKRMASRIKKNKSLKQKLKGLNIKLPVPLPRYIEFDYRTLTALVVYEPNQSELSYNNRINLKLVREHYN
jgi:small subunit ribosomal protein S4